MKKQHNEKVVVGDVRPSVWNRFNFLKPFGRVVYVSRKKLAYALVPILLIVLWGLFYYGYIPLAFGPIHPRYFATVGSENINYSEYSAYIKEAKERGINKQTAEDKLIESYKYQIIAQTKNMTVPENELMSAQNTLYGNEKTTAKNKYYFARTTYAYVVKNKLQPQAEGDIAGAIIEVNFGQHLFPTSDPEFNSGVGNAALIAKDKQRAQAYAQDLSNRLISKKISLEQAVTESVNKRELRPAGSFNSRSSFFDKDQWKSELATGLLGWPGVKDQLRKLAVGEISKPIIMQVNSSLDPANPKLVDAYYGIFAVTSGSGQSQDFTKYINATFATIKVKRYV